MSDQQTYTDDDLVYVDPKLRIVVGRVEYTEDGTPKSLEMQFATPPPAPEAAPAAAPEVGKKEIKGRPPRVFRKRNYPWGTYRTMKKIYRLEGKEREKESSMPLDTAIARAQEEPYWNE